MSRYHFPIPFGWFYAGSAGQLSVGDILPLRRFGRDLILWRDEDGVHHLQDAYCPHLGANIGVGGKVKGTSIECPFHHWRFNGDGKVTEIPYAKRINEKACLRSYPLKNQYGSLMAWYHPEGKPPSFELPGIPELDDDAYVGPFTESHTIRTCLQEMAENTVDSAHFQTIHKHAGAADYEQVSFDGSTMRMDSTQQFPSSKGAVEGRLDVVSNGFGFAIVRYKTLIDVCMVTNTCPIETDLSQQVNHVYYHNPERDPRIDRIGEAFVKEVNRQLQDDIPIWENKIYRANPQLCDGDGPISKFRQWAAQFYAQETTGA